MSTRRRSMMYSYTPGRLGFHPDGTPDPEAIAIKDAALNLAETLSAGNFESLSKHANDLILNHRTGGIEHALSVIDNEIEILIPFSSPEDKATIARAIFICSARMLVWKPEATEECQKLERKSFCMRCN
jgi:hypothetical protein